MPLFDSSAARHRYRVIVEDGKCGAGNAAISAATKLITLDKVDAPVVCCSGEILQIADAVEKNRVPTMVVYASHPKVKHLGPHIFRVFEDIDNDIPILAGKMKEDGRSRVAVITEELPFTMGIKDVLVRDLAERVVVASDYSEGSNDFRAILLRAKSTKSDAIFLNAASVETLGPLVKQIADLGMMLPLYSFAYASVPTFIKKYSQYVEGMVFVAPPPVTTTTEAGALFNTLFIQQTRATPLIPFVATTAYDGTTARIAALDRTTNGEPEQVIKALNETDFNGVLGRTRFDANGDAIGIHYTLHTIRAGVSEREP